MRGDDRGVEGGGHGGSPSWGVGDNLHVKFHTVNRKNAKFHICMSSALRPTVAALARGRAMLTHFQMLIGIMAFRSANAAGQLAPVECVLDQIRHIATGIGPETGQDQCEGLALASPQDQPPTPLLAQTRLTPSG